MGKIFGISNLPISTLDSTLKYSNEIKSPNLKVINTIKNKNINAKKTNNTQTSNFFIKMRNGFGKLMSHFSKKFK